MTLDFYQLKEHPFGGLPDSRFLFVSSAHRQALGTVLVALQKGVPCVSLIGPAGLGKTTLLYHTFNTLKESLTTIYLFQPPQSPVDFFRALLADLGVREMNEVAEDMFFLLKDLLADQLDRGKRVVVIVDEAQNVTSAVLEVLGMLSDSTSAHGMLLQFVLSGQGQMSRMEEAVSAESEQLSHRHAIVARLAPLSEEDTAQYVNHRLRVAGYGLDEPLFTPEAIGLIARYSEGVPRKINDLCYSALCLGYNTKRARIDGDVVREVVADLGLDRTLHRRIADLAQSPRLVAPPSLRERPRSVRRRRVRESGLFLRVVPKIGLAAGVLLAVAVGLVNVRRYGGHTHTVFSPLAVSSHAVPRPRANTFRKVSDGPGNGAALVHPSECWLCCD